MNKEALETEITLLKKYFEIIVSKYPQLDENEQWKIAKTLREWATDDLERAWFDPQEALRIRKKAHLSREKLASMIPGLNHMSIFRYEKGISVPDPEHGISSKYWKWLNENGYSGHKEKY